MNLVKELLTSKAHLIFIVFAMLGGGGEGIYKFLPTAGAESSFLSSFKQSTPFYDFSIPFFNVRTAKCRLLVRTSENVHF
jgi:hypothetical protein